MADRMRWIGRRVADFGSGLVDALVRDNRVLPPVLAVLALFIIAWILAGAFMGETDQKPVAHKADLAQSDLAQSDDTGSGNANSPGVENRDVNSYAAYRSKDPFRELLAPEETTTEAPTTTTPEETTPETTTVGPGAGGARRDTDGDGVPNRRERKLGSDPNNPDTDGDGIPDGSDDDANGDGRPDTAGSGAGPGAGSGAGSGSGGTSGGTSGSGQSGSGGSGGQGGGLLNSGGTLPVP